MEESLKLKKCLVLSELYPPLVGGSSTMFASRFALYPPEHVVVLTKTVEKADTFDKSVRYLITRVPLAWKGPKGFEWLGITWKFIQSGFLLARACKVDVIECARPLPEGVAGYIIAKLLRKKLVVNFHGEDIAVLQNYKVERFLLQRVIRAAQLNLANSRFTESLIQGLGGPQARTAVISPGFYPKPLEHLDQAKISQMREQIGGQPILLTVGRLQRRKGQDQVIRALPRVIRHFPEVKYVIVGSTQGGTAGLAESLQNLAEEVGVSQHVLLVGEVNHGVLPYYYAACDLFLMPNRREPGGDAEGFGIVFLEAGFLGKPVIGGNSGGVPDAVQHGKTGVLVDGESVEEIAEAILQILSDENLARTMSEQGRAFAQSLTHEKVFERYQTVMAGVGS
ncbi:glycosyltransferase [candidate division KSB3 bacterium]|uniref:Glycosyltransferase n=1 Tax=candidate division KSB3 bacterium TaxID=2044937 RepID=A0A9D5K085_9BACT|nr:glycosyltransferase [candidate division KSB3 bacterium]MBD3327216.1 glycosyltransferase [candidate division KSB3 bacterium]